VTAAIGVAVIGQLGEGQRDAARNQAYEIAKALDIYKLQNGKYVAPVPLEEKLKLSPFIANAMVYGDNRVFNIALLVPDFAVLEGWAKEHGLDASSQAKLLENPRVRELMKAEVEKSTAEFKGFEEIKKFDLLPEDFTTDNGMLTPSMKMKRRVVVERFKDKIEALYA
jgi:long-chain acyl-CoA synthetase